MPGWAGAMGPATWGSDRASGNHDQDPQNGQAGAHDELPGDSLQLGDKNVGQQEGHQWADRHHGNHHHHVALSHREVEEGDRGGGGQSQLAAVAERHGAGANVAKKQKIGRNDPCYCGSGKKYKRCHG